jgi:hypothetical protein
MIVFVLSCGRLWDSWGVSLLTRKMMELNCWLWRYLIPRCFYCRWCDLTWILDFSVLFSDHAHHIEVIPGCHLLVCICSSRNYQVARQWFGTWVTRIILKINNIESLRWLFCSEALYSNSMHVSGANDVCCHQKAYKGREHHLSM